MFKRMCNYQNLLMNSIYVGTLQKIQKQTFFGMIAGVLISNFVFTLTDGSGMRFFPFVISLYFIYLIITSGNKLYEIVPVSKKYTLINIYLFVLTAIICVSVVIMIVQPLMFLLISAFGDNIGLFESANEWKLILIMECITIIIAEILLPLFFIRMKMLRLTLIAIVVAAVVFLRLFLNSLTVESLSGKINLIESIKIMPNFNVVFMIFLTISVIMIPTSMLISYRIYRGKRCKT